MEDNEKRIADALERIAVALEKIAGESKEEEPKFDIGQHPLANFYQLSSTTIKRLNASGINSLNELAERGYGEFLCLRLGWKGRAEVLDAMQDNKIYWKK